MAKKQTVTMQNYMVSSVSSDCVCVCVYVHSAGVGRTGTFIALDRLMQHIREHEFVDVLGMVSEMRSHRLSMVQTEVRHMIWGEGLPRCKAG